MLFIQAELLTLVNNVQQQTEPNQQDRQLLLQQQQQVRYFKRKYCHFYFDYQKG
jgi:hypothetical protein